MTGGVKIRVLVLDVEEELAKGAVLEVPGRIDFAEFLGIVCAKYPRFRDRFCPGGALAPYAKVFIDGRALAGPAGQVGPGSEVVFFPAIHGG